MHSISRSRQALYKQAAVERDPVRLLALFLRIDRLAAEKAHNGQGIEQMVLPESYFVECPHCSAIIDPAQRRIQRALQKCPWCDGPINEPGAYLYA